MANIGRMKVGHLRDLINVTRSDDFLNGRRAFGIAVLSHFVWDGIGLESLEARDDLISRLLSDEAKDEHDTDEDEAENEPDIDACEMQVSSISRLQCARGLYDLGMDLHYLDQEPYKLASSKIRTPTLEIQEYGRLMAPLDEKDDPLPSDLLPLLDKLRAANAIDSTLGCRATGGERHDAWRLEERFGEWCSTVLLDLGCTFISTCNDCRAQESAPWFEWDYSLFFPVQFANNNLPRCMLQVIKWG